MRGCNRDAWLAALVGVLAASMTGCGDDGGDGRSADAGGIGGATGTGGTGNGYRDGGGDGDDGSVDDGSVEIGNFEGLTGFDRQMGARSRVACAFDGEGELSCIGNPPCYWRTAASSVLTTILSDACRHRSDRGWSWRATALAIVWWPMKTAGPA